MKGCNETGDGVGMQNILAIFVGIVIFLLELGLKYLMQIRRQRELKTYKKKRLQKIGSMFVSFLASIYIYYLMSQAAGLHYKLCCAYKSWVIALVLYAVYKQFFLTEIGLEQ